MKPAAAGRGRKSVLVATATIALVVAAIGVTALARKAGSPPRALAGPVRATEDEHEPAKGMFLVSRRELSDPNFSESVVLLLQYSDHGAMGLIINRRTELALSELLPDLDLTGSSDVRIFSGGPVSRDRVVMLVRSDDELEGAQVVFQDVQVSRSRELLERLAREGGDGERFRVYLGYAGWGPAQLNAEIDRGDWHVMPGNSDVVFHRRPGGVWRRLLPRLPDQVARDGIGRTERFPGRRSGPAGLPIELRRRRAPRRASGSSPSGVDLVRVERTRRRTKRRPRCCRCRSCRVGLARTRAAPRRGR